MFDVGGIIGAIAAGVLSDYTGMSACTCAGMLIIAIPLLLVYQTFGTVSLAINIFLLFIVGIVVNGPYALITTSVSTELGIKYKKMMNRIDSTKHSILLTNRNT